MNPFISALIGLIIGVFVGCIYTHKSYSPYKAVDTCQLQGVSRLECWCLQEASNLVESHACSAIQRAPESKEEDDK